MTKAFVKKGIVGIYLLVQTAMAMAADIKGVVIDKQSGEPLIGAAVLVDGLQRGGLVSHILNRHRVGALLQSADLKAAVHVCRRASAIHQYRRTY